MPNRLSKNQIISIHSLRRKALPTDAAYRDMLAGAFPKKTWSDPERPSTSELTPSQAHIIINALIRLKNGQPAPHANAQPRYPARGGCTQKQANEIARLERRYGWHTTPKRLRGWIEKYIRPLCDDEHPGDLSKRDATTCITGLRKLTPRHYATS